jgi:hypothetical protein
MENETSSTIGSICFFPPNFQSHREFAALVIEERPRASGGTDKQYWGSIPLAISHCTGMGVPVDQAMARTKPTRITTLWRADIEALRVK